MKPKISVIIPSYNAGKTIGAALNSVLEQVYDNIEIVVVDGLSKDNTADIVNGYKDHNNIIFISEKDKGVYDAMNKGIVRATGDWLFFLGADDTIYTKDTFANIFNNDKPEILNADIVYGNILFQDSRKVYAGSFSKWKLLRKNISHQAIFYKKTLFDRFGGYDLKYPLLADYVYNLVLFSNNDLKKVYVDDIIAIFCEEGLSSKNRDLVFKKDRSEIIRQNYSPIHYIYGAFIFPLLHKIERILKSH